MKRISKLTVTSVLLAVLISSCNSSNPEFTSLQPATGTPVNQQEVSAFASESANQIAIEFDKNQDDKITPDESLLTGSELEQIDNNGDGTISKTEIVSSLQNDFTSALNTSETIRNQVTQTTPQNSGNLLSRLPASSFKNNKVQLYVDKEEILPMVFDVLRSAKKSIQMDLFLFGGNIGLQVAQELVKKSQEGIDIKLNFDPNLGFAGPTQQEILQVIDYLKKNNVDFRLYPLHLIPKVDDGFLKNKFQIDHDKLIVVDDSIFLTGGFNLFDYGVINRDIMFKIEGPTAQEVSDFMSYEWSLSDKYIDPKPPKNDFVIKADQEVDAQIKVLRTAPFESTTKPALIEQIDNAKQSVYLGVLEFSDMDVASALIRAFKRGVDVRIIMDRKNTNDKYAGGVPVPNYFPNILPATELVKNHVPTRWYDSRTPGQELHMKMCVVDGNNLIAGSTNFTRQAFTTFRETSVQVMGGSAPQKMNQTFLEDWNNHSTAIKKITLSDKIKAKVVEYLDKKYYGWW